MALELLAPTTSASASENFSARHTSDKIPCTFIVPSLASGETATLQITVDGGTTWVDLYIDGTLQQFTDTNTAITAYGPGTYRVNKGATASAVGCYVAFVDNL